MNNEILISAIGFVGTILAAVLSPILSRFLEKRKTQEYMPIAPLNRRSSLLGQWKGNYEQKIGKESELGKYEMSLNLFDDNNINKGSFILKDGIEGRIINIIYDGRILKFDYLNKDENVVHFGTFYGLLSANGKTLHGEFLGYGLHSEMFVSGIMHFEKETPTP